MPGVRTDTAGGTSSGNFNTWSAVRRSTVSKIGPQAPVAVEDPTSSWSKAASTAISVGSASSKHAMTHAQNKIVLPTRREGLGDDLQAGNHRRTRPYPRSHPRQSRGIRKRFNTSPAEPQMDAGASAG